MCEHPYLSINFELFKMYRNLPFFWYPKAFSWVAQDYEVPNHLKGDVTTFRSTLDDGAIPNKDVSYNESAGALKRLLETKTFSADDLLRQNAEKLFVCHRENGAIIDGGLAVRTTVQLNLFGGSVANLGDEEQRQWLQGVFDRQELGCFALTEAGAGVLSGLVVLTTAKWTPEGYIFSSGSTEVEIALGRKVWISQGYIAKWAVVVARLILPSSDGNDEDKGPHAFVVDLETVGIKKIDMDPKVAFNSLDNAMLEFRNALIPHSALLRGVSSVDETTGKYILRDPSRPFRFEDVAQRLLSGRICIAGASLSFMSSVQDGVEAFAKERRMPAGKDKWSPLIDMPFMRDQLMEKKDVRHVLHRYVQILEKDFASTPSISNALVHKIACAKILCVEFAINAVQELKERVGSLSLFQNGPFGSRTDFLYVFRFAEGDSAVLRQKMARDSLKVMQKSPFFAFVSHFLASTGLFMRFGVLHPLLATLLGGFAKPFTPSPAETRAGLFRSKYYWDLMRLACSMIGVPRRESVKAWLECHSTVERVANRLSVLTVYDSVKKELKGSRQLNCFAERYMSGDNMIRFKA